MESLRRALRGARSKRSGSSARRRGGRSGGSRRFDRRRSRPRAKSPPFVRSARARRTPRTTRRCLRRARGWRRTPPELATQRRTHLAEYERLVARLTAALSSSVDCDETSRRAPERRSPRRRAVDAWGDVARTRRRVADASSPRSSSSRLRRGGLGRRRSRRDADETRVVALLEKIRDADAIANAWLTLRETGQGGGVCAPCRPVDAPRDAAGLLSDARATFSHDLSREDEMRPMLAARGRSAGSPSRSLRWSEGRGPDARATVCAATATTSLFTMRRHRGRVTENDASRRRLTRRSDDVGGNVCAGERGVHRGGGHREAHEGGDAARAAARPTRAARWTS